MCDARNLCKWSASLNRFNRRMWLPYDCILQLLSIISHLLMRSLLRISMCFNVICPLCCILMTYLLDIFSFSNSVFFSCPFCRLSGSKSRVPEEGMEIFCPLPCKFNNQSFLTMDHLTFVIHYMVSFVVTLFMMPFPDVLFGQSRSCYPDLV